MSERLVGGLPVFQSGSAASAATAAEVTVTLGWKPDYILFQPDCADTTPDYYFWRQGMAVAGYGKVVTAGTVTFSATSGFAVAATGFTIPAALQVDAKTYSWQAFRYSA